MEIRDPSTQKGMGVDQGGRGKTSGVSRTIQQDATSREDSFNVNSGTVVNAVATEQGILYLKNNEDRALALTGIVTITGLCANGTENNIKIYKNPTTGTLISEATAADTNSNRHFSAGSPALVADVFKGDGSATVTDGSVHIESIVGPSLARVFFPIDEVLTKGDSIAITFTIAGNNSSTNCMAALICHLADPLG